MPATINGIGTHYYGKRNLQQRPGVCAQCGSHTTLASYDTRLWFVVIFIPIIPLGRKRIINACPCCRRHFLADLQSWETAKQLETSGAMEKFRSEPTAENAMEAHRQLVIFHQETEALELQKLMVEKFADNAKVQIHLAQALVHLGRQQEADGFFVRALELRPDLPEARVGVAEGCIRAGQLDRARELLDFLTKPGAAQLYKLGPLERLAMAFQRAGRHQEALELFGKLIEALPRIAENKGFRRLVKTSEKALKQESSILPKVKFSLRGLFGSVGSSVPARVHVNWGVLLVIGVLIAGGMLVSNEYIRRHRTLYLVNGLAKAAEVEISGLGPMQIRHGVTPITLGEGHYRAKISGPIEQEVVFDVRSFYVDRWINKPAWVLNIGSAAVLQHDLIRYSKTPGPPSVSFYFGEPFYSFNDLAYPFETPPRSIRLSSGERERAMGHLDLSSVSPADAFGYLLGEKRREDAYKLAEWRLRFQPLDEAMLEAYAGNFLVSQKSRVEAFLTAGLTNRPVQIAWHRAYQNLFLGRPGAERLLDQYTDLLKADPTNSALLYLRGRLCGDHELGTGYFNQARAADPANAYPLYAVAYDRCAAGNWEAAKPLLDQAVALRPEDKEMLVLWINACAGAGQLEAAEKTFRERVSRQPGDAFSRLWLCQIYATEGKTNDGEQVIATFARLAAQGHANDSNVKLIRTHFLYAMGQFEPLEQVWARDSSPFGRTAGIWRAVEQDRPQDAVRLSTPEELKDPIRCLTFSLAFRLTGNIPEAESWESKAVAILKNGGADSQRTAALLEGRSRPTEAALHQIIWPPKVEAVLYAELSLKFVARRTELAAAARRLNVERTFPYHLIQRATAAP